MLDILFMSPSFIGIRVTVELSDHQEQVYEYRRRTIDDLDPQKSHFEVR